MDIGFVVHVHVFNVHRGSIAFRDHLKTGHDISQSSLLQMELVRGEKFLEINRLVTFFTARVIQNSHVRRHLDIIARFMPEVSRMLENAFQCALFHVTS